MTKLQKGSNETGKIWLQAATQSGFLFTARERHKDTEE